VPLYYVDASALVKLVRDEPESDALRNFLADADLISSEVVLVEVRRAIWRAAGDDPALPVSVLAERASELLDAVGLLPLDRALLEAAAAITEPALRALDAIHIVSAIDVSPLDGVVTYDVRQGAAARLAGLRTVSPGV
jgi:predicted nucleic acid-binding protein